MRPYGAVPPLNGTVLILQVRQTGARISTSNGMMLRFGMANSPSLTPFFFSFFPFPPSFSLFHSFSLVKAPAEQRQPWDDTPAKLTFHMFLLNSPQILKPLKTPTANRHAVPAGCVSVYGCVCAPEILSWYWYEVLFRLQFKPVTFTYISHSQKHSHLFLPLTFTKVNPASSHLTLAFTDKLP